ncbi:MAG: hypothetical protein AAF515_22700 [Pseudomonadota bacterium]
MMRQHTLPTRPGQRVARLRPLTATTPATRRIQPARRSTGVLRAALSGLLLVSGSALANVLLNPGFEAGASDWSIAANHALDSANARSGGQALRLTSTGGESSYTTWSTAVDAAPGSEFDASAWVKATGLVAGPSGPGDTPLLVVRFPGVPIQGFRWAPWDDGTYDYTNEGMGMRFQVPAGGNRFQIGVRTWSHNTAGQTYWDDLLAEPVDHPLRGALLDTLQAEDADKIRKASVHSEELDFTGTGYVDVEENNAIIIWRNVPGGGDRVISVRYSWEGFLRPITLQINGQNINAVTPPATGRRGIYGSIDFLAPLTSATKNTIKLKIGKAGGLNGQPLIDRIDIFAPAGGSPPLPPPAVPTGLSASDGTHTDKVALSWDPSIDATSYEVARDLDPPAEGAVIATVATTAYDDTSAVPLVDYAYRVRACSAAGCSEFGPWETGYRDQGPQLDAQVLNAPANADLSLGAADYLKPGAVPVRRANVGQQISAVSGIGDTDGLTYNGAKVGQQWNDGDPTPTGNNVKSGLRVFADNNGLQFSAAAGTVPRELTLWITSKGAAQSFDADVTASISDGSSADVAVNLTDDSNQKQGQRVVFNYAALADGETLTVSIVKNAGSFVGLDAIKMTGGDPSASNQPPTLEGGAPITLIEGDSLFSEFSAVDPEGTELDFTLQHTLPNATPVLTEPGGGLASVAWDSAMGDVGSWSFTLTVTDADDKSTSVVVPVTVQPLGSGSGSITATTVAVGGTINLADSFIKFQPNASTPDARNATGPNPFSALEPLGDAVASYSSKGDAKYSYTNATPANGTKIKGGNRVFNAAPAGMRFGVEADTTARTLRVFVGVQDALAKVRLSLADDSAAPVEILIDERGNTIASHAVDVAYQADTATELRVELFVEALTEDGMTGWVQFEAARQ